MKKVMAKGKSATGGNKLVFGKKKIGKAKKRFGPNEQKPKKYKGQGR